jgi:DNA topoisomerase-1
LKEVIIIESPNKVHTIEKIKPSACVLATKGHFRDLPKNAMGISFPDYSPIFVSASEYGALVEKRLKFECKDAIVYIATDPDREGFAIGKFVYDTVKSVSKKIYRAEFYEITKKGVEDGLAKATDFHSLDMGVYFAFLGRRLVDRLIGYIMSPKATKALGSGVQSVGRVKSVTMAILVQREEEIEAFKKIPKKDRVSYKAGAILNVNGVEVYITSPKEFETEEAAIKFLEPIVDEEYAELIDTQQEIKKNYPLPPLLTSDMLERADKMLRLDGKVTMQCAQDLFTLGLVTYIRVDSARLATEFTSVIKPIIEKIEPKLHEEKKYESKNSQSDAHEAIRPSDGIIGEMLSENISAEQMIEKIISENGLDEEHEMILRLIYARAFASQCKPGIDVRDTYNFEIGTESFSISQTITEYHGHRMTMHKLLGTKLNLTEKLNLKGRIKIDTFDIYEVEKNAPKRYTEGDLTKYLEKNGIGRPSTYVSYLESIKSKAYIETKERKIYPTQKAIEIVLYLRREDPWLIDVTFTSEIETYLDEISTGANSYVDLCKIIHSKMNNVTPAERSSKPTENQTKYAKMLSEKYKVEIPKKVAENFIDMKNWIEKIKKTYEGKEEC